MKVSHIACILFIFLPSIANAETEKYIHGNSIAEITIEGAVITVKYAQNGDGFSSIAPGGPVFEGAINKRTGEVGGTAYFYDLKCGSFPYSVYGRFEGTNWVLKLKGLAPVLDSKCHVVAYTPRGPNANLDFHKPE